MIKLFDNTLPCGVALLEYSEGKGAREFDLSVPLNLGIISEVVSGRNPECVETCEKVLQVDPKAGLMFDNFLNDTTPPDYVSFETPEALLGIFNLNATIVTDKQYYATVLYPSRDNEIRVIYRNKEKPDTVTDAHDDKGNYLYSEQLFTGGLPEDLSWATLLKSDLEEQGLDVKVNHFKVNKTGTSKVYFRI